MNDVSSFIYDIDPVFQRNNIKSRAWKQDMISHIVWTKQTGTLFFHPVEKVDEDGERNQIYQCVDGKSRTYGMREFMSDAFTIRDCGYPHLDGIVFSKWPLVDKSWFKRIPVNIATCDRTLTQDEITKLFKNLKTPSDVTIGELLNSSRDSPLGKMYQNKRSLRPEFAKIIDKLWGKSKRHVAFKSIANLAHTVEYPDSTDVPLKDDINAIWNQGISSHKFDKLIEYTLATYDILCHCSVPRSDAITTFLPFFKLFVMQVPASVMQLIKNKVKSDVFKGMPTGGDAKCVHKRYRYLLRIGGMV
jgi:hypothetical protein